MIRLNVYAGMIGAYIIQSPFSTPLNIIDPNHDLKLIIYDRTFNTDASLYYPNEWISQFYGDALLVNGKLWPFMQIENGLYRIRIINGCGSRYLNITFNFLNDSIIPFTVVKADGNYLNSSY